MPKVATTVSLAIIPENNATEACHVANPAKAYIGAINVPILPSIEASLYCSTPKGNTDKSHITTTAGNITIPAFFINAPPFSHVSNATFLIDGIL